jgi:hypothetical protein
MIEQIQLKKFRCFEDNMVPFKDLSLIIGKNNAGKSTIIEALRIVSIISNRYKHLTYKDAPAWLGLPRLYKVVSPSLRDLDFEFGTAIFRYEDPPAEIVVDFKNRIKFHIYVTQDDVYAVIFDSNGQPITSRSKAAEVDVPQVNILPQIGPLLRVEKHRGKEYVVSAMNSSLTSLHFRNQLLIFNQKFEDFRLLAESTWPGLRIMDIKSNGMEEEISLIIRDGDFAAEVGWMGNGLQMWLQIMWFLSHIKSSSTVILDEPDVYMHPDLQRKLIRILKFKYNQAIVATHSIEMISEVEPQNILMIDKNRRVANFANSIPVVQRIIDHIGGVHNLQLARLGTARKCIFVEGKDMDFLKGVYEKLYGNLNEPLDIIPHMTIGGWNNWPYAIGSSLLLKNEAGESIKIYCILDRDYHTPKEISSRLCEAEEKGIELHIWSQKEIENYFIIPSVILRIIRLGYKKEINIQGVISKVDGLINECYETVFDAYSEHFIQINRGGGVKSANTEARKIVDDKWKTFEGRLSLVSGKDILKKLSFWCKNEFNVHLSLKTIIKEIKPEEINNEMRLILETIHDGKQLIKIDINLSLASE